MTNSERTATQDTFNEKRLRADIVATWGAHGAHADVFDTMMKEIEQLREQRICDGDALHLLMDETDDLVTEIDFLVGEFRRLAGVVDDGTAAATIVWDVLLRYSESQP